MAQHKSGLHKRISSIFDGTPVPKTADEQPSSSPTPDYRGHLPPQPPANVPTGRREIRMPARVPQDSVVRRPDIFARISKQGVSEYIVEKLSALKRGQFADKQKIKILVIPILSIILILVLYRSFTGPSRAASRGPEAQVLQNMPGTAESAVTGWQKPEPYPIYMRDPTQLSAAGSYMTGTGSIAVRGIVFSEDNPAVVVGSEIMHEGDTVGGATILKINRDSVEFTMEGKVWTQRVQ